MEKAKKTRTVQHIQPLLNSHQIEKLWSKIWGADQVPNWFMNTLKEKK